MIDELGELIWRERRRRGWSLRELGQRAGVSLNYLSRVELGEANPSLTTATAILKALGFRMEFKQEDRDGDQVDSLTGRAAGADAAGVPGVVRTRQTGA